MAYKSVAVVTVYINKCLQTVTEDESYFAIAHEVDVEAESMAKPIDQRVKRMVVLQLFCTKKVMNLDIFCKCFLRPDFARCLGE